jgi:molybdopterin-guanine dinucleotide biosynthesis protein A
MPAEFTGIVLAGGRSRRMGRDKALLPWGQGTLLDRMIAVLATAGATRVLVSGDRPAYGGIGDVVPDRGPVGGLHAVLRHVEGPVLVVPVDLPRLRPERVEALLAGMGTAGAAMFAGHPLPCALHADDAARAVVDGMSAAGPGGVSVLRVLEALGAIVVPVEVPDDDLRPCNTPAQWSALAS